VLQSHPFQKFHDDERLIALLSDLVDRANVGMVQGRSSSRLTSEPFQSLRVLGYILWQEFQGDEASQIGVFSLVDDTHPTATELLDDAVVRDGQGNHAARLITHELHAFVPQSYLTQSAAGWILRLRQLLLVTNDFAQHVERGGVAQHALRAVACVLDEFTLYTVERSCGLRLCLSLSSYASAIDGRPICL
jgi:hypothetical protein